MNPQLFIKLLLMLIGCSAAEWLYVTVARKSFPRAVTRHTAGDGKPSVTGGGIIFFPALAVMLFIYGRGYFPPGIAAMLCAMGALWLVSYIDDLRDISPTLRLLAQIAAMGAAMFYAGGLFLANPWVLSLAVLAAVALINASNFIDGINSMFAGFAIVTLVSLIWVIDSFIGNPYLIAADCYLLVAVIAFSWFNVAMRDIVFAGDVGSITVGFFVAFILAIAALAGAGVSVAALAAVYIVDVAVTICRRILLRENLLHKHKHHLYQILAARGYSHQRIAWTYAAVQAAISAVYILLPDELRLPYFIIVTAALIAVYFVIIRKTSKSDNKDDTRRETRHRGKGRRNAKNRL